MRGLSLISIHAPRAGSDEGNERGKSQPHKISIHAPRAGSDAGRLIISPVPAVFQSTLPVRGATCAGVKPIPQARRISIHAPRAGSDGGCRCAIARPPGFQSTLPVRGATTLPEKGDTHDEISIHAPRAGSDGAAGGLSWADNHFNPRSPCGERPRQRPELTEEQKFQSTLPVRGATVPRGLYKIRLVDFNPRSPCGERPANPSAGDAPGLFQSTLPVRGATD